MIVDYIDALKDEFGVEPICTQLQVAPSTYYAAKAWPASARSVSDADRVEVIGKVHADNYGVYGVRKVHAEVERRGHQIARGRAARDRLDAGRPAARRGLRHTEHPPGADFKALLREEDGGPVAAIVNREGAGAGRCGSWTYLPGWTTRRSDWLKLSIEYWRDQHPERFPHAAAEWALEPKWMTAAELAAQRALDDHEGAHGKAVAEYEARRIELGEQRERARSAADSAERRLLTSGGESLVDQVTLALIDLGFGVTNADGLDEHASAKKEDLRVKDGPWTALVEVKGNAERYAQTSVFLQVGSAVETYVQRNGAVPDARWYVVNQAHATPPPSRARPFPDRPSDLDMFAGRGGLVIDTRDLFRLREAVRAGDFHADAARALLEGATGVFEYPAEATAKNARR